MQRLLQRQQSLGLFDENSDSTSSCQVAKQQKQQMKAPAALGRAPLRSLNSTAVSSGSVSQLNRRSLAKTAREKKKQQQKQQQQQEQQQQQQQQLQLQLKPRLPRLSFMPAWVTDADQADTSQLTMVSDYVKDIFVYLSERELQHSVGDDFLIGQAEVTSRMRCVLIDWLQQLCRKLQLQADTFFLCVGLLDRFLQADKSIAKSQLQLLGAAALWLASKVEEIYCVDINDLVYFCNRAYDKREFFRMELRVVSCLEFQLTPPLGITFLRRLSKVAGVDNRQHHVAKYLLELASLSSSLASRLPSELAAASLCMAMRCDGGAWTDQLTFYSGYTERQLATVMAELANSCNTVASAKDKFVYTKYRSAKLYSVATMPQLKSGSQMLASLMSGRSCGGR